MTRPAPLPVTQAFATATCFHFFFFEADIDKALGGFITAWLAMALALRFGYPLMAMWLAGGSRRNIIAAKRVSAGTAPYHPHRTFM